MIASFGMALRYSFDMGALADKVDAAIAAVLANGLRTAGIRSDGATAASTTQMGEAIFKEMQAPHALNEINTTGKAADNRPCPQADLAAGGPSGESCSCRRTNDN